MVTSQNEDEDNDYKGYMQFGDGAILSIQELLEALSVLDRDKKYERRSDIFASVCSVLTFP